MTQEAKASGADLVRCWMPRTKRQLPNLQGIPILIVVSEASYHAPYDHCTAKYLAQAGVANEHIRLEARGIRGNAHGIPSEMNNLVSAKLVDD